MSSLSNMQLQALVDNLTTRAPKATFNVDGVTYTSSKIASLAGSVLTARSGSITAKGEWKNARSNAAEVEDGAAPILEAVRGMLVSMFTGSTVPSTLRAYLMIDTYPAATGTVTVP